MKTITRFAIECVVEKLEPVVTNLQRVALQMPHKEVSQTVEDLKVLNLSIHTCLHILGEISEELEKGEQDKTPKSVKVRKEPTDSLTGCTPRMSEALEAASVLDEAKESEGRDTA